MTSLLHTIVFIQNQKPQVSYKKIMQFPHPNCLYHMQTWSLTRRIPVANELSKLYHIGLSSSLMDDNYIGYTKWKDTVHVSFGNLSNPWLYVCRRTVSKMTSLDWYPTAILPKQCKQTDNHKGKLSNRIVKFVCPGVLNRSHWPSNWLEIAKLIQHSLLTLMVE